MHRMKWSFKDRAQFPVSSSSWLRGRRDIDGKSGHLSNERDLKLRASNTCETESL